MFRAHLEQRRPSEQRDTAMEERHALLSPLRFYARCGMALAAAGLAGALWQIWTPA